MIMSMVRIDYLGTCEEIWVLYRLIRVVAGHSTDGLFH